MEAQFGASLGDPIQATHFVEDLTAGFPKDSAEFKTATSSGADQQVQSVGKAIAEEEHPQEDTQATIPMARILSTGILGPGGPSLIITLKLPSDKLSLATQDTRMVRILPSTGPVPRLIVVLKLPSDKLRVATQRTAGVSIVRLAGEKPRLLLCIVNLPKNKLRIASDIDQRSPARPWRKLPTDGNGYPIFVLLGTKESQLSRARGSHHDGVSFLSGGHTQIPSTTRAKRRFSDISQDEAARIYSPPTLRDRKKIKRATKFEQATTLVIRKRPAKAREEQEDKPKPKPLVLIFGLNNVRRANSFRKADGRKRRYNVRRLRLRRMNGIDSKWGWD